MKPHRKPVQYIITYDNQKKKKNSKKIEFIPKRYKMIVYRYKNHPVYNMAITVL